MHGILMIQQLLRHQIWICLQCDRTVLSSVPYPSTQ